MMFLVRIINTLCYCIDIKAYSISLDRKSTNGLSSVVWTIRSYNNSSSQNQETIPLDRYDV